MPRWKALPEELDPQVREFTEQLRRIVDRSGMSLAAIADGTGYSKSSWERYLNGRLLPPRGATQALADVTGTEVRHLATMWELAERAWSRSEMRHDMTMEAIQVAQARAALGESGDTPAKGRRWGLGRGRAGHREPAAGPPDGVVAPPRDTSPVSPSPLSPPSRPGASSGDAGAAGPGPEGDDATSVLRRQRSFGAGATGPAVSGRPGVRPGHPAEAPPRDRPGRRPSAAPGQPPANVPAFSAAPGSTDEPSAPAQRKWPVAPGQSAVSAAPGNETARPHPPVPPGPGPAAPAAPAGTDAGPAAHPAGGAGGAGGAGAAKATDGRHRIAMAFAGVAGALVVIAAAVFAFDLTGDDSVAAHPPSPSAEAPELPAGVECAGKDCAGKDPEVMGCGGQHAKTVGSGWVGSSLVEVRYSEVCGAAWGRVTGGGSGDSLKIISGKSSRTGKVDEDNDAYTPMVPAKSGTAARACLASPADADAKGCVKGGDTPPTAPGDAA